ncbi:hypothetical protein IG631_01912 [Alternaria alternata]|nr:hypothetical protein IG631_01912 [Alternaria alternata]
MAGAVGRYQPMGKQQHGRLPLGQQNIHQETRQNKAKVSRRKSKGSSRYGKELTQP